MNNLIQFYLDKTGYDNTKAAASLDVCHLTFTKYKKNPELLRLNMLERILKNLNKKGINIAFALNKQTLKMMFTEIK